MADGRHLCFLIQNALLEHLSHLDWEYRRSADGQPLLERSALPSIRVDESDERHKLAVELELSSSHRGDVSKRTWAMIDGVRRHTDWLSAQLLEHGRLFSQVSSPSMTQRSH